MCCSTYESVRLVSGTRGSKTTLQDCYNHFPSWRGNGKVFRWISLGLPTVHGKDCIYVVVDKLTTFAHFFAIPIRYTTAQVTELFFRKIFRLHGLPKNIVSDRDIRFMRGFWQEFFRLVGTELTPSTSYHVQRNGQTKRVNQWLEGYLRNYVTGQQRTWIRWLHLGEYCYNTRHHMSIGMTPFCALYGYDALSFADIVFGDNLTPRPKIGSPREPRYPQGSQG